MYAYPSLFFFLICCSMAYSYVKGWVYDRILYVYYHIQEYQRVGVEIMKDLNKFNK